MKKPTVKTKKYLDWQDIKPYLKKNKIDTDQVLSLFADYGDFHNGCFETLEDPGEDEDLYEPALNKVAKFIFKEWPDAVDEDGTIQLYIWW